MAAIEGKYPLRTRIRMAVRGLSNRRLYDRTAVEILTADIERDADFMEHYTRCSEFTMTSVERMYSLFQACAHLSSAGIEGAFVECGVWRGGSAMLAARTFLTAEDDARDFWLYDTFEGMSKPSELDLDLQGGSALDQYAMIEGWCEAPLSEVEGNLRLTGYPTEKIRFIKGLVEDTIPDSSLPEKIALLRLDTDFYESTKVELEHLYPRLVEGGVLIIDDYGYWDGARQAVDEYFAKLNEKPLLTRIDVSGRIAIKP